MKRRRIAGAALVVLLVALLPASTGAAGLQKARFEGVGASFKLRAGNGYTAWVSAYSLRRDGKGWISIAIVGDRAAAFYRAPARVTGEPARDATATALEADLGRLGRVDLLLERSGVEKTVRWKCGGPKVTYEPGVYRGVFEFKGEDGYTSASASEVSLDPMPFFPATGCGSSGHGETWGPGIPGARLKGLSFAHDRILTFQVNKNNRRSRVVYSASVHEQRDGIRIYRTIQGTAGPGAFSFDRDLDSATLRPPAPFSGSATLRRDPDSLLAGWQGNLQLTFPGHTIPLADPGVHVSLVHAHLTGGDSGSVVIGF
ncbi:MAG TPA: hypothetical protein VFX35_05060 [Solirubrobacterales bacterium]|nr:hypothetical protein [Solirubrobacterales bacterium]